MVPEQEETWVSVDWLMLYTSTFLISGLHNSNMFYDTIVVGAGVVGCATAYTLAKQGKKTLLLEQVSMLQGVSASPSGKCSYTLISTI